MYGFTIDTVFNEGSKIELMTKTCNRTFHFSLKWYGDPSFSSLTMIGKVMNYLYGN